MDGQGTTIPAITTITPVPAFTSVSRTHIMVNIAWLSLTIRIFAT
jgi:hypothetical protein